MALVIKKIGPIRKEPRWISWIASGGWTI